MKGLSCSTERCRYGSMMTSFHRCKGGCIHPAKTVYRIQHPDDGGGMWYDENGNPKSTIAELCPNGVAKEYPMPFNPLHRKGGKVWKSTAPTLETMHHWFSTEDAEGLYKAGFRLYSYKVTEWQDLEFETLIRMDTVIEMVEIPITTLWKDADITEGELL